MTHPHGPRDWCTHCGGRIVLCAEGWEHTDHAGNPAGKWRTQRAPSPFLGDGEGSKVIKTGHRATPDKDNHDDTDDEG